MVTCCPSCNTLFRVTPQQLQAHYGQVRCGRCMTVFDGFKELATLPEETAPSQTLAPTTADSAAPAAADRGADAPPAAEVMKSPIAPAPEPAAPQPIPAGFECEPIEVRRESATRPFAASAVKPRANRPDAKPGTAVASSPAVRADALFLEQARAKRRRRSWLWSGGSLLMLFALAGQAAYFYRGEVVAKYPGLKPMVAHICALLRCSVPLPQRPQLINIEASDLQSIDPARPGVIQLTATLRNHAGYDLGYPALDLVLTNTQEHTLARRIFLPGEYLAKGKDPNAGLPANAEITIRLDLDTGDLGATGFRLDLLPAPTP